MKILITGGAGFIGSHLAEAYLKKGHEVYIIDNFSTGSIWNIIEFHKDNLWPDTILDKKVMSELINKCDIVFHLAAAVGVQYILDNPLETVKTNIQGTENVLELCSKFNKRVLITSTSEVYGKPTHAPLVETDDVIYGHSKKARWSYATSKLIDEFTALAYHRIEGLEVIIARLFNTVGPRQTGAYGMVIPRLMKQALNGESLIVYGSGLQTRTFVYVKDVVKALILLMESKEAIGEVVNVGGTEEISIHDLAVKIIKMTNSKSPISLVPYKQAFEEGFEDIQRRVPSTEKLKELIGFEPSTSLDDILKHIIDYSK